MLRMGPAILESYRQVRLPVLCLFAKANGVERSQQKSESHALIPHLPEMVDGGVQRRERPESQLFSWPEL